MHLVVEVDDHLGGHIIVRNARYSSALLFIAGWKSPPSYILPIKNASPRDCTMLACA